MRRVTWLTTACLLGGLAVVALVSGLRTPARAAEVMAPRASARDVVINEVAWGGTAASPADEWIELYNNTGATISLEGWHLVDDDNLSLSLSGIISPHGYYLIERADDNTVSDIPADWFGSFGSGGLSNSGEVLTLTDNLDNVIDTANADGGGWPEGSGSPNYYSMERKDPTAPDIAANWCTNDGVTQNGLDAGGNPINGTPKAPNSCYQSPTPDLAVAKSGPATVGAGDLITYHITLGNSGLATATTVLLTDTLPAGVDFVAQASPFTFTLPGGALVWEVGDVPTGTQHTFTVTGRVTDTITGTLTNLVTATTTAGETVTTNNSASWVTTVAPPVRLYALAPANYEGSDEAAALINLGSYTVPLDGWRLDDDTDSSGGVSFPPTATIAPGQILWLAQDGDAFYPVWGFDADWAAQVITRSVSHLSGSWPGFTDHGEEAYLLDADGNVVDALAYGDGSASQGWSGQAVPYKYSGYASGQVIYRKLDQSTGLPVADTDTGADWAQDGDDPIDGRKLRYPGWDLEELFFPAEIGASAHVTLAVAPEGTLEVVSQTIAAAQHALLVEAYTLESVPLYEVISARIRAGVVVTVLLESKPAGGMDDAERWIAQRLHDPPAGNVYFIGADAPRYSHQHAKFILVDDQLALVSSDNFGESSMPSDRKDNGTMGHRGFVVVTDGPGVIARLKELFRLDCDPLHHRDVAPYDDTYAPPGDFTPLSPPDWTTYTARFAAPLYATADHLTVLHAPEHALRDRDALLGLLGRAGNGDRVAVMQMNEPFTWTEGVGDVGLNPRLQALVAAAQRGATVRVLLDEYYDQNNTETCLILNGMNIPNLTCRLANVTGLGIHAKLFLMDVDGERWVHLGSINGTETSNKWNREAALQFRSQEAHRWMQTVFENDWVLAHGPMVHIVHLPLVVRDYVAPASYPLISELLVNPSGDDANREWIELYNPGPGVSIAGWTLGDALDTGDYGDGRYTFPTGAQLAHGQVIVAAACATDFSNTYGKNPDYEWTDCDAGVPNLTPVGSWDGFGMALGNTGDELLLLNGSTALVDSAAWGGTSRAGVTPFTDFTPPFPSAASLKRYPPDTDRDDCARDFYVSYNPSPGVVAGD